MTRLQSASMLPVLSTASLAHGVSFQARDWSERVACSEEAQFRSPAIAKVAPVRREIIIRKSSAVIPKTFNGPRQVWVHLDRDARKALDRAALAAKPGFLEVRSTDSLAGNWEGLNRHARLLGAGENGFDPDSSIVVGNGRGSADGEIELAATQSDPSPTSRTLAVYLVGDFFQSAPTRCQWEALDEVMDYLSLKWGRLKVCVRQLGGEAGSPRQALGPLFPVEDFLRALNAPPTEELEAAAPLEAGRRG